MILLALETSSDYLSVAVATSKSILGYRRESTRRSHAENIVPAVNAVLADAGLSHEDLDSIAVSTGPGSYTGLRIGVSTAKGYAMALNTSVVAVPTLAAMAYSRRGENHVDSLVLLHARKNEWYVAEFDAGASEYRTVRTGVLNSDLIRKQLGDTPREVHVICDEAAMVAELVRPDSQVTLVETRPDAKNVADLGMIMLSRGETANLDDLEPDYFRTYKAGVANDIFGKLGRKMSD